ncbi:DUF92 domain-containing protein [Phnomibacter ginsenosidimutans]|uniref:DUF92 domain-containing protein n=1 Tax=Phnomibacter ginsenosidimutans TaxID=2676868 RepID=A0A6I6GF62_9BACT|nr:DUF92 domain-containing protein [Phnomibacter ginsenosidimutans]QGW29060.1 DUF92 domain-containing protein [Phnomibacter ginsenosidimutans]
MAGLSKRLAQFFRSCGCGITGLYFLVAGWALVVGWVVVLFVSGTALGKLPRSNHSDAKMGRPRDWVQVLANGGIAAVLLLLHAATGHSSLLWAAWISLAVSNADTWSSEIGQWAGGKVVDILRWQQLTAGVSGGVSWQGTVGGAIGAGAIAGLAWLGTDESLSQILIIAFLGFSGMLFDSVLGSLAQAKYASPGGSWSDQPPFAMAKSPQRGWAWMTNDAVNWLSNLLLVTVYLLFYW